jgi:uncharacterized protein
MMITLVRRLVSVSIAGVALAGCATSPATRFYVLTPLSPNAAAPNDAAWRPVSERITIGVRAVDLPDELDRPQIVTRTGPNRVQFAEFDRWSASLRDSVMQLIATNLSTLLPGEQLAVYPWSPGTVVDREVIVEVTRFDGALGGECALQARWRVIARRGTPSVIYGQSTLTAPSGADYPALVATQSRLVGALSAEIARAIRGAANTEATASTAPRTAADD